MSLVAIVTGSHSGIGRTSAVALAEHYTTGLSYVIDGGLLLTPPSATADPARTPVAGIRSRR